MDDGKTVKNLVEYLKGALKKYTRFLAQAFGFKYRSSRFAVKLVNYVTSEAVIKHVR